MKIKLAERIILFSLFFINPIISLKIQSQLENNTKIEIISATETLNLYKNSEIVVSHINDNGKLKKVKYKQCEKCTTMKKSIDRILPRRKRFLIYPSASNVVVTLSLVKALTFSTPRGYNMLGEVDFFYPLPDKIYYPHHRTTTTEAPPPTTMPPEVFDHHHSDDHDDMPTGWDHDHHDEIFMPPGGWQDDIFKNINPGDSQMDTNMMNADAANSSRRYWDEELSYRDSYNNLGPPIFQPQSTRRLDFIKPKHLKSPAYYRRKRSFKKKAHKEKVKFEDHTDYKSHRDRRDLYSNIESIFEYKGIHIRTCILRAICEAKHFLLPKGKSLFHDIFRILFTIPTKKEMIDEYSNAVRNHDDSENCWKLYETECPISILELLLKSKKIL